MAYGYTVKFPSLKFGEAYTLIVDYAYGRIYWLKKHKYSDVNHILSSDYRGKHQKYITNGSLNTPMGVFGDLLYFQNHNISYINEMNVSNGQISRNIQLPEKYLHYRDLIIVHNAHRIRSIHNAHRMEGKLLIIIMIMYPLTIWLLHEAIGNVKNYQTVQIMIV